MATHYLLLNKERFGKGLTILEQAILAQVEEYEKNKCPCFITNEQFAFMFGVSLYQVKTALDNLERVYGLIWRETTSSRAEGGKGKMRVIHTKHQGWYSTVEIVSEATDQGRKVMLTKVEIWVYQGWLSTNNIINKYNK